MGSFSLICCGDCDLFGGEFWKLIAKFSSSPASTSSSSTSIFRFFGTVLTGFSTGFPVSVWCRAAFFLALSPPVFTAFFSPFTAFFTVFASFFPALFNGSCWFCWIGVFLTTFSTGGFLTTFSTGGFFFRPMNRKAFPREISTKSSSNSFFCFFLFDSLCGVGGLFLSVIFSANLSSLASSRTNFPGSIVGGGGRNSMCGSQVFRACKSALIPLNKWLGQSVESEFRSLRSFFSLRAASQLTASNCGNLNFCGVLIRSSIS